MPRPTRLVAVLMIGALLLSATGSPFVDASAVPQTATPPNLGTAITFGVLGGQAVTNTETATLVDGDLGVSPGTAITGFPPGTVNGTIHAADGVAAQAQLDLTTAYEDLAGQACDTSYAGVKELAGETLPPGVYCAVSFALNGALTLQGSAADVWVFKSAETLITGSNAQVILSGGAVSCNVWWQVGSSATLGTFTNFHGNILALTSITLNTSANLWGAALARNGSVTMDNNHIDSCFGPNAIGLGSLEATPEPDLPLGVSASIALLALGLLVARLRRLDSRDERPSSRQEAGR